MRPWTEREIARYSFRAALFGRRGLAADSAERLADRLALRDQHGDARRTCVECKHRQRSKSCFLKLPITVDHFQLIRCAGFSWQAPA